MLGRVLDLAQRQFQDAPAIGLERLQNQGLPTPSFEVYNRGGGREILMRSFMKLICISSRTRTPALEL